MIGKIKNREIRGMTGMTGMTGIRRGINSLSFRRHLLILIRIIIFRLRSSIGIRIGRGRRRGGRRRRRIGNIRIIR